MLLNDTIRSLLLFVWFQTSSFRVVNILQSNEFWLDDRVLLSCTCKISSERFEFFASANIIPFAEVPLLTQGETPVNIINRL